jgi:hypothetical protein
MQPIMFDEEGNVGSKNEKMKEEFTWQTIQN